MRARSEPSMKSFQSADVASKFEAYPPKIRRKMMALRRLILETAAATRGVGEIEETLKWGEPAYVTSQTGSGSTVRIDWKKAKPGQYAMYFNCQTNLVETFRTLFPRDFKYEGNRAIVFDEDEVVSVRTLEFCIVAALTYHRSRQGATKSSQASTDA